MLTTLIGGFVVWGGIGWLLDRWLGTAFLTPIGLILGMALGIYAVVAKYGRLPQELAAKPGRPLSRPAQANLRPVPEGRTSVPESDQCRAPGRRQRRVPSPDRQESFFFDPVGDGTVIASTKAMVLLVLGAILIIGFFIASARARPRSSRASCSSSARASTASSATASPSRSSANRAASGPASLPFVRLHPGDEPLGADPGGAAAGHLAFRRSRSFSPYWSGSSTTSSASGSTASSAISSCRRSSPVSRGPCTSC